MTDSLEELIEIWKYRIRDFSFGSPENEFRKMAIEECIEDLQSTMHVMEANRTFKKMADLDEKVPGIKVYVSVAEEWVSARIKRIADSVRGED